MEIARTPEQARDAYDAMSPDEQARVRADIKRGVDRMHAVNLVRSGRRQDAARAGVGAEDEQRELTDGEAAAATAMGAADAMSLGLADEAAGVVGIPSGVMRGKSVGDAYSDARDDVRMYSEGKMAPHAKRGQAGAMLASALGSGAAGAAAKLASGLSGSVLSQGARLGGATGVIGGFGGGDGFEESVGGAVAGGALGALLGAAPGVPAAVKGIPSAMQGAGSRLAAAGKELALETVDGAPPTKLGASARALKALIGSEQEVSPSQIVGEASTTPPEPPGAMAELVPDWSPAESTSSAFVTPKPSAPRAPSAAPAPDYTAQAEAFDPGGVEWKTWASGAEAPRTPRPDLDEAAQVLSTKTTPARTPAPRTPAPGTPSTPAQPRDFPIIGTVDGLVPPPQGQGWRADGSWQPDPAMIAGLDRMKARMAALGMGSGPKEPPVPSIEDLRAMYPDPGGPGLEAAASKLPLAPPSAPKAPMTDEQIKTLVAEAYRNGESLHELAKRLGVPQYLLAAKYKGAQLTEPVPGGGARR